MHIDLNDPSINNGERPSQLNKQKALLNNATSQKDNIDAAKAEEDQEAYNVPFNLYVEGSYFGDSDCLFLRKCFRECMSEADQECHLLVIKKNSLEDLLDQFNEIKNQMVSIAAEKRKYHKRLINELLRKQKAKEGLEKILYPDSPKLPNRKAGKDIDI